MKFRYIGRTYTITVNLPTKEKELNFVTFSKGAREIKDAEMIKTLKTDPRFEEVKEKK